MSEISHLSPLLGQLPQMDWSVQIQIEPPHPTKEDVVRSPVVGPPPDPYLIKLSHKTPLAYIPFMLFILSEVLLGLAGFYLSAAEQNTDWYYTRWNWSGDSTYAVAVGGGVEGVLMPYSFFYSCGVIGIEGTLLTGIGGAYLGGAAANGELDPARWNWITPKTINAIFQGIQNTVWLVDAIESIYSFSKDAGLRGVEDTVFKVLTYGTGAFISYYYIAEDNNGNYNFWEWDWTSPEVLYGIIRGFESGTRLPVGFGEIIIGMLNALESSLDKPNLVNQLFDNFIMRNKWKVAGALWLAIVYTSDENETLEITRWNFGSFGTLESFLNGIVFGKDLDEMFMDVRKYLLGTGRGNYATGTIKVV